MHDQPNVHNPIEKDTGDSGSTLGQEDPLKEGRATYSSILAMDRGAWRATVHGVS